MPPSSPWPSYPPISPSLASWTGKLYKAGHWSTASSNCFLATIWLTSWPIRLASSMIGTSSYPTSRSSWRRSLPRSIFTKPITSDLFCAISHELNIFHALLCLSFDFKIVLASYFINFRIYYYLCNNFWHLSLIIDIKSRIIYCEPCFIKFEFMF